MVAGAVMRTTLRWLGRGSTVLILLVVAALATVYAMSEMRMRRTWQVEASVPPVPADAAAIARGEHLATIRGCRGCHAPDMGGATFIDSPPFAKLSGTNLTPGKGGVRLSDEALVRAIRHGVGSGGRSLLFMPSQEFAALSESDMGDLLAYLHSLSPVDRELPPNQVGPLGRLLFLAGKVPLLPAEVVDHATRPAQPQPGPTAAYGEYLAAACKGCHGPGLSGGHIPGTPPNWPDAANLTLDPTGLAAWSEVDLRRALREGVAPGGRALKADFMPVRETRHLSDDEIAALYAYFRSLPPRVRGSR
jgi:cytochrome c553